jgi:hypothetical protein
MPSASGVVLLSMGNPVKHQFGRLVQQVGRRGAFLLFLALLDGVYAYSLFYPTASSRQSPTSEFLISIAPLWVWGLPWAAVGLVCGIFAFVKFDWPGFAAAIFIKVLWSVMFLTGWIFVDVERGYLSSAIWGAFGLLVALVAGWRETDPLEREIVELEHRLQVFEDRLYPKPHPEGDADQQAGHQ